MFFLTTRYHRFAEQAEHISDIFLFDRFCDRHQNQRLERLVDDYYQDEVAIAKQYCQLASATRSWRGFIQSFTPGTKNYSLRKALSQSLTRTNNLYQRIIKKHHGVVFNHYKERAMRNSLWKWVKQAKKPTYPRPNIGLRLFQHATPHQLTRPTPLLTPYYKASASN